MTTELVTPTVLKVENNLARTLTVTVVGNNTYLRLHDSMYDDAVNMVLDEAMVNDLRAFLEYHVKERRQAVDNP